MRYTGTPPPPKKKKKELCLCSCAQMAQTRFLKIGSNEKGGISSTFTTTFNCSFVQTQSFFSFAHLVGEYFLLTVRATSQHAS